MYNIGVNIAKTESDSCTLNIFAPAHNTTAKIVTSNG